MCKKKKLGATRGVVSNGSGGHLWPVVRDDVVHMCVANRVHRWQRMARNAQTCAKRRNSERRVASCLMAVAVICGPWCGMMLCTCAWRIVCIVGNEWREMDKHLQKEEIRSDAWRRV